MNQASSNTAFFGSSVSLWGHPHSCSASTGSPFLSPWSLIGPGPWATRVGSWIVSYLRTSGSLWMREPSTLSSLGPRGFDDGGPRRKEPSPIHVRFARKTWP
eukprot:scaffold2858_cov659-Pavlova_lutheri.AAC.201